MAEIVTDLLLIAGGLICGAIALTSLRFAWEILTKPVNHREVSELRRRARIAKLFRMIGATHDR